MNSIVQLDKKEWEAFLKKLSELEKKYPLVLHELDEAHSRLQALDNSRKQQEKNSENPTVPAEEQPSQRTTGPKNPDFLSRLKTKLRSLRIPSAAPADLSLMNPNAPPNYALCSRCGARIMHATRFCERCGAGFGKLVCSCGRGLSESVRFCDHCGRRVEDMI